MYYFLSHGLLLQNLQRIAALVPRVLTTLMSCFKDSSWAVRDAACSGGLRV